MLKSCKYLLTEIKIETSGRHKIVFWIRFSEIFGCGLNDLKCDHAMACRKFISEILSSQTKFNDHLSRSKSGSY